MYRKFLVVALVFASISHLSFVRTGFSDVDGDFWGVWIFGVGLFSPVAIPVIIALSVFPSILATKQKNKVTVNLSTGIIAFLLGAAVYSILIALLVMFG